MRKSKITKSDKNCYNSSMKTRKGFTVVEVVIAIVILFLIAVGIYGLAAYTYSYMKLTEEKAIAKNVAMYTVEYIKSRNVTSDNLMNHSDTELGMDNKHYLPGIVDLWDIPLTSIGHPKGSTTSPDFDNYCINIHPATPGQTYLDSPNAFYFSLQGFNSIKDPETLTTAEMPISKDDSNLYVCNYYSVDSTKPSHYHVRDMYNYNPNHIHTYNHITVRFPLPPDNVHAVKNFSGGSSYIPMIYTTDTSKTQKDNINFCPFYTTDTHVKTKTMDYTGFRVLTKIVARKQKASDPDHVQYYDVKVTVFWEHMDVERSYAVQTQIVTYGGS